MWAEASAALGVYRESVNRPGHSRFILRAPGSQTARVCYARLTWKNQPAFPFVPHIAPTVPCNVA